MDAENMMIRNAIVHILDKDTGLPVLSDCLLEHDEDFYECMKKYIVKLLTSDDKRECQFDYKLSGFYQALTDFQEENLIPLSQQIANYFYQVMQENPEIPGGDLLVATCQLHSEFYLAILKLNYKQDFTHITKATENGNANHIILHRALLPSATSRLSEAAVINLSDYSIYLTEKKYEIGGEKRFYLSELVLQCHTKISENDKMKLLNKTIEQINKKYFEENFEKKMEIKDNVSEELVTSEEPVSVRELPGKLYADYPNIQAEFQEKMEEYDIMTEEIHPENPKTTKKYEKQFLTTDSGIEINIPMDIYRDKHKIEFITDVDGSIQIVIKNIQQLFTK